VAQLPHLEHAFPSSLRLLSNTPGLSRVRHQCHQSPLYRHHFWQDRGFGVGGGTLLSHDWTLRFTSAGLQLFSCTKKLN
jgi:hypothetical protein